MKKIYEMPEMKITVFNSENVLTVSTGANLALNDVEAIDGNKIGWN